MKYKFTSMLIVFLLLAQFIQPIVLYSVSYATTQETQEEVKEITQGETQEEVKEITQGETQEEVNETTQEEINENNQENTQEEIKEDQKPEQEEIKEENQETTQSENQEEVDKPTQEETIQQETIDSFSEMLNSNKDEIESISVNLGFTSEGVPEIQGGITINQIEKTDKDEQQKNSEEVLVGASIGSTTSVKIVEKPEAATIEMVFRIFKALDKKINLRIQINNTIIDSTLNNYEMAKSLVELVNYFDLNNNVNYISDDRILLKRIKQINTNANICYVINKWNWEGSDSIVSYIKSFNNNVLVEVDGAIYKDSIAQTFKYNGIPMKVRVNSLDEILKLDKSVYGLTINNPDIGSREKINEYFKKLKDNFGNYTDVNPSEVMNYRILAKDNCGVMFQTIQNSVNSNVRLSTNYPARDESLFSFKNISNDQYMIISKKNSFALSAKDYYNNSRLILVKQNQADKKQLWRMIHNSNGTVSFINVATGKAIQPEQDAQKMNCNLIQSIYVKDKNAQAFFLYCDDIRIQTTSIRVYLPNINSEISKIDFSFAVNKKVLEKDVVTNTYNQIYNEVKKKLNSLGLKDEQFKIYIWKDNSHSTADDLLHYYIRVNLINSNNAFESNPDNYTKVDPSEAVNYKILSKDNSYVMFQNTQNNIGSNVRLFLNIPAKDESLYRFKKISNVGYMIISKKNSFAISAKDYNNNSKLILAKQNQADKKQIWRIVHNSNGTVAFVNVATGKAIQPEQDKQNVKNSLIQSTYVNNKNSQSFYLYSDEIRIQTTDIRVYLPDSNSEMGKIDFGFAVNKKITEKDVITNTNNQIYNEIKKKLTSVGFKDGQYKINIWKDNNHSIADDLFHYYIRVNLIMPDNTLESNPANYTKVDPCEAVNYKILTKNSSYIMLQNTQNNVGSNIRLYINVPAKDESLYRFKKVSNTGYMIISKKNSLAISAKDYNNNSKLILAKQNQADKKQIWKIVHNSNGTVAFVNSATGKAIQPEQDKQNIKYSLIQSTYVNNKNAQSFYLYSDEVRIQTTDIRVYLPKINTQIDKIDFSFATTKKITEKDVITNTYNQIYNEIKKKLTSIGLKDGQYKINIWKDNSHSIADDLLHYYIRVDLNIPDFPSTDSAVEALTHRGYKTAPELTRPAYWMARVNGFHYSGADIRVTKDGVPVLYHDPNLVRTARTANGGKVSSSVRIENLTYAEAMKYDYGLYKSSAWKGTQLTTLDQYIRLCKQLGLVTNLHLKPNYSNLNKANLKKIVDTVNKYGMRENVYYASENKDFLTIVKSFDKDANFDYLVLSTWNWDGEKSIVAYLETLKSPKNKVEIALSKGIYQDAIAKTMEFNGFRFTINADSPTDIIGGVDKNGKKINPIDKSIDVISTDTFEPTELQKLALQRPNNIGTYIKTDPKEQTAYKIHAKDNCGVMFQTIQNTVNSNVRLYSDNTKVESMFTFKKVSNGGYMIISKKNSLAISAKDNNNNSKLILAKQNQYDKKQIWKIVHNSNGTVSFVNVATGKAIQPEQSTQKKGYVLIQSTYNKSKNAQQFFLQQ